MTMRITYGISDRNFMLIANNLNEQLETASQQVSTGKKLLHLNDSPSGSAEAVTLKDELAQIDQYRANSDNSSFFVGVSDSVLSSVTDILTTIFTQGSSAASSSMDDGSRAIVAGQIRLLRDQILSLANTQARGRYIFAGSQASTKPFTLAGDQATYLGDSEVNSVTVNDGLGVKIGVSGSEAFSGAFSTIADLLTALDNNDLPAVQTALMQFSSTMADVNHTRGELGTEMTRLQDLKDGYDSQETNVRVRQSQVEDADLAKAIVQMNQIQTSLQATLTTKNTVHRQNLFDYLG
jgi:flagellar hook-associated protein 3 FlgL